MNYSKYGATTEVVVRKCWVYSRKLEKISIKHRVAIAVLCPYCSLFM